MTVQPIPVPFHGQTLYLINHNDEPYTPMRPIVEGMGLDWKSQHRKLAEAAERWSVVIMTTETETAGTPWPPAPCQAWSHSCAISTGMG